MAAKKFTTSPARTGAVEFEIDGTSFQCRAFIPGSVLMEHTSKLAHPNESIAARELLEIWKSLMEPDEYRRFRDYIDSPERMVDLNLLGEILAWAVEELGGRPTQRPSASRRGPSTEAGTSSPSQTGTD